MHTFGIDVGDSCKAGGLQILMTLSLTLVHLTLTK